MTDGFFDPAQHKWHVVDGAPDDRFKIHHYYTILGHDLAAGTLDMVVKWDRDGGHCHIHRHTATTTVLVLEGEQQLWDLQDDGALGQHTVRRAGDYALLTGFQLPHLERGGDGGSMVFFGNHSSDGKLYEILDDDLNLVADITMELLVADWEANAVYLDPPDNSLDAAGNAR